MAATFLHGLDATGQIGTLLMEQTQSRQQQQGVFGGRLRSARSQGERLGFQHRAHLGSRDAPNALLLEQASDFGFGEFGGARR